MSIGMAIGVRVPDISWLVRRSKLRNGSPNGSKRITLTATSSTVGSRSVVDFRSAAGRCAQPALLPPARCTPMTKPCSQRRDSMQAPAAGPDRRMTSTLICVPTPATAMARPRHRYRAFPDQATTVTVADLRRISTLVELYAAVVLLHHQHGRST